MLRFMFQGAAADADSRREAGAIGSQDHRAEGDGDQQKERAPAGGLADADSMGAISFEAPLVTDARRSAYAPKHLC